MTSKSDTHHGIDFSQLTPHECYKVLIGSIVPRPIAWITTIDNSGRVNAAPFSFFNALSADPPLVGFGIQRKADGVEKDTLRNIQETGVFTINIVNNSLVEAMSICAIAFPEQDSELVAAGLSSENGILVPSPRILDAPVSLECKKTMIIPTGPKGEIVLGEVVFAHIHQDLCDPEKLHIDQQLLDAVGRMGGQGYSLTREYFDLSVKSVDEWAASQDSGERIWSK